MLRRSILLLLLALLALLQIAPAAEAGCIKRHEVRIATGTSPSGWRWTVDGSIGNNGNNCSEWLFGMDFELEGATNWGSGTGIPAGGHLGRGANEPSAFDALLEDGSYRVFSGFVGGEVTKVLVTLSNNKHLTIRPKSPPRRLLQKVVWLRSVHYFVDYYPPEGFATGLATFSASGQLLYRDKSWEGF
jgi:hypothetical protein